MGGGGGWEVRGKGKDGVVRFGGVLRFVLAPALGCDFRLGEAVRVVVQSWEKRKEGYEG